jgi:hypothetical protein
MADFDREILRATAARDAAVLRSRKLTAVAVVGAAVLTAGFTALAAGATHAKRIGRAVPVRERSRPGRVVAPAAPLVAVEAPRTPAPPPSPPAQATPVAPPVVVSGGS